MSNQVQLSVPQGILNTRELTLKQIAILRRQYHIILTALGENIFRIGRRRFATPPNTEYIFSQLAVNIYILFDGLTYNTRGYFASCVVFFRAPQGQSVSKKMHHLSFRALANDVNGTESQPNPLFDCINEMTRHKR